jgi:predicted NBD/HSP70 family sugar kinase
LNGTSRSEIARLTGLRNATISNIMAQLIEADLVVETGMVGGQKGRRSIGVALSSNVYDVIAVRITRENCVAGIYDILGTCRYSITRPLVVEDGSDRAIGVMIDTIKELLDKTELREVVGLGVALPGPFIKSAGRIALMSEFPGWERIEIESELAKSFSFPIVIEHDANAAVLAEWMDGPHRLERGMVCYLAAGQGIGAGFVDSGSLIIGATGTAGEIGHTTIDYDGRKCACGNRGCLGQYASTIAIRKQIMSRTSGEDSDTESLEHFDQVVARYHQGDPVVVETVDQAIEFLGIGIVNVVNTLNPNIIVIGDELATLGPVLLDKIKAVVKERTLPAIYSELQIELSTMKEDPVLSGICGMIFEKAFADPSEFVGRHREK